MSKQIISFRQDDVILYGLERAVFLSMLELLINNCHKKKDRRIYVEDNQIWIKISAKEMEQEFFIFTQKQINNYCNKLKELGAISVGKFDSRKYDMTNYYSINRK
jgi:hypothetical protein